MTDSNKKTSCVCDQAIFCKYHYSAIYYQMYKDKILKKQKQKYNEKVREKKRIKKEIGNFLITFD